MKPYSTKLAAMLALSALLALDSAPSTARAQGTAFTYQGQLQNNGGPANGNYNIAFAVYDSAVAGNLVAGPVTNSGVAVTNGLFTVAVDFGSSAWNGRSNWMQIAVEANGSGGFTTLTPRQQVTPAPCAIFAENANSVSGTLPASQLTSIGNDNFFIGSAGNSTTTGYQNTAIGVAALLDNTSGLFNTADGDGALMSNTGGSDNTALGNEALISNTTGFANTASGSTALLNNITGAHNTANGEGALTFNMTGNYNTADGSVALNNNQTGNNNTALGYAALGTAATGNNNTAIGVQALEQLGSFNNGGSNNIAVGYRAGHNLFGNESGNIDIGNAGVAGESNVIRIGDSQTSAYIAGQITGDGSGLTNLNVSAAQLTSIGNTNNPWNNNNNFFVGPAGNSTMGGGLNTGLGVSALSYNTSGADNTAVGVAALVDNTSGSDNTAVGVGALWYNTNASGNTAIGTYALWHNASGYNNTAVGSGALQSITNGSCNTALGQAALAGGTNGCYNTAIGYAALDNRYHGGTNNIALGYEAGFNITTGSSNIDIGNQGLSSDANVIRIGASQTATYLAGTVYANGVELTSDRNAKENFKAVDYQALLARVAALPVTEWNYKRDGKDVRHIGPMAQDFKAAFGLDGADDKHISVVDEGGVALAAVQGLNQKLESQNAAKDAQIKNLEKKLDELQGLVVRLAAQK